MSNEEIMKKYKEYRFMELNKQFSEDDIRILEKLGIVIEDKKYTEYEFERITMKLVEYFNEDESGNVIFEEEKADNELLRKCGVSPKEFLHIIDRVDEIEVYYNI